MSACSVPNLPQGPRNPIKVNGVAISRAMISREAQNHPSPTPIGAWKQAALALVLREALRQEIGRRDITVEPLEDGAGRRETEEEASMRTLVEQDVAVPEPGLAECRRYYEQKIQRFRSADLYEPAHILIAADRDDAAAYETAREQARALIAELAARPEAFADLARLHSACPSRELGGNLGQISSGQTTPDFEAALVTMRAGEIAAEPVETRYGVHVVRLDRKIEGRTLPFELVHERIAAYLSDAVQRRAQAQYVARLLASARVEGIEIPSPGELNVH